MNHKNALQNKIGTTKRSVSIKNLTIKSRFQLGNDSYKYETTNRSTVILGSSYTL